MEKADARSKARARTKLIFNVTEDLLVLMEDRSMSKSELARALGKSRSFVSQILSGSRNMTLGTLSDICQVLNVEPIVKILPDGSQVLAYDEIPRWQVTQVATPESVSHGFTTISREDTVDEYQRLGKVSGLY